MAGTEVKLRYALRRVAALEALAEAVASKLDMGWSPTAAPGPLLEALAGAKVTAAKPEKPAKAEKPEKGAK